MNRLLCIFFILSILVSAGLPLGALAQDKTEPAVEIEAASGGIVTQSPGMVISVKQASDKEVVTAEPDFSPVTEELIPLKTRIISISARNTSLKDVLYTVGENTGLNIIMEAGVNPDQPLTLTLKEVEADEALNIIFSSVDYFYELNGNVLIVKSMDTRMFEFSHPAVLQNYSTDVGGDLFGATEDIGNIKGGAKQSIKASGPDFDIWESMKSTVNSIIEGSGRVDINKMSGTLLVTSTKKKLKKVEDYINRIKSVLGRRVLVEARIVEVKLTDNLKYGIDWTFLDKMKGVGSVFAGSVNAADPILIPSSVPGPSMLNSTYLDTGYFVATLGNDFSAIITALDQQGDTTVLSNPRLGIMNGQSAILNVGRKTDYISEIDTTVETTGEGNSAKQTFSFDVTTDSVLSGVMLGIMPVINEKGEITMTITPIVSDVVEFNESVLAGPTTESGSYTVKLPVIDLKELSTVVKVKDGEMIIIGGHIDKKEGVTDKRVPFLGKLPLIGYLFNQHEKIEESSELVILLKATVDNISL
ncbi:MAG: pilus (MSHA type) biogenesis protein MshL [Nitrospirae bacterium]|nr:pilus (MSHA type) biogenesis protein MshL [Nitrospirota bacterium]